MGPYHATSSHWLLIPSGADTQIQTDRHTHTDTHTDTQTHTDTHTDTHTQTHTHFADKINI